MNQGVPGGLIRTATGRDPESWRTAWLTRERASSLAAGGTASSRSSTTRSGRDRGALAARSGRLPGTNSTLRQRKLTPGVGT